MCLFSSPSSLPAELTKFTLTPSLEMKSSTKSSLRLSLYSFRFEPIAGHVWVHVLELLASSGSIHNTRRILITLIRGKAVKLDIPYIISKSYVFHYAAVE